MRRRTFVTFEAAFPDEAQWTDDGSPLVPDGRSIALFLVQSLTAAGLSVSKVIQHSFYGWAWEVYLSKTRAWCLLQGGDPWLLLVEERGRGLARFFGATEPREVDRVLRALDATMKQDAKFSSIRWFTKQEYESGGRNGAESPL